MSTYLYPIKKCRYQIRYSHHTSQTQSTITNLWTLYLKISRKKKICKQKWIPKIYVEIIWGCNLSFDIYHFNLYWTFGVSATIDTLSPNGQNGKGFITNINPISIINSSGIDSLISNSPKYICTNHDYAVFRIDSNNFVNALVFEAFEEILLNHQRFFRSDVRKKENTQT